MNKEKNQIKKIAIIGIIIALLASSTFILYPTTVGSYTFEAKAFSSYDEFFDFLKNNYENMSDNRYYLESAPTLSGASKNDAQSSNSDSIDYGSVDYSETNIQVEGVDEPDIVKTDGVYIYIVANSKVYIINAFPADDARVISEISFEKEVYVSNIFINENRLIILGQLNNYPILYSEYDYYWNDISSTIIYIYDIGEKSNPKMVKDIEVEGYYSDSRMIDNYVYVVCMEYTYNIYPLLEGNESIKIPNYRVNDLTTNVSAKDIYYMDIPEKLDVMTNIISIDIFDEKVTQKSFLVAGSQDMYVSKDNIYLAYTQYYYPFLLFDSNSASDQEKTIINKISIDKDNIEYVGHAEVPGRVLNQFSMDEFDGFFRIATTIGQVWSSETKSSNNIYILDEKLNRISEIEDIAPGEQIYSARFMGEKAYLVTFKKIDPFFTIDLSDPYNPEIIGKLKIPGYSDYLHPFDENHIIGIGKEAVEALGEEGWRDVDFAWYQGIKIALFDVSDFENPKEISKITIGDRGTDSPALYDHKAFLFDHEKELLVIPINLYEIDQEIKDQNNNYTGSIYGEFTFQGAYVYDLSLEKGFEYKGRITHMDNSDLLKVGYYPDYSYSISRSLYIGDVLYTISNSMLKMNDLNDLNEINNINFI